MNERGKDRDGILDESGTCEETALLDAYLDGELTEDEAARLRAHLDTCPVCRAYWDDIRAIREAFPTLDDVEVPEGFAERVLDRLPPRISVLRGGRRRTAWRRAALPIAASLALVLALRGMWLTGGPAAGDVFTRSIPETQEAVQETENPLPSEDVSAEATDSVQVEEEESVQEESVPAAEETVQDTELAENAAAATGAADGGAPDAGTPENGESGEADAGTASAAAENTPAVTETVPSETETASTESESPAVTDTTPKSAGNKNEEQKPAAPKNSGTNSKAENGGKSSNGGKSGGTNGTSGKGGTNSAGNTNGGTSGKDNTNGKDGTGNQPSEKPAAPTVPATPEPAVSTAPEQTAPTPEVQANPATPDAQSEGQAAPVSEGQTAAAPEQSPPAESAATQAEQPEDAQAGFYQVEGGSPYVSGYEDLDGEVNLFEVTSEGTEDTADTENAADTEAPEEPERAFRNTAHHVMYLPSEAAFWLERYSPMDYTSDGAWYELSGEQFKALARALEGTGLADDGRWADEAAVTEPNDTVYVVLRNR